MKKSSFIICTILQTLAPYLLVQVHQTESLSVPVPVPVPVPVSTSTDTGTGSNKYSTPVVICPGFGNDLIDYDTPLDQPASKGLRTILSKQGFNIDNIYTVPIKRTDWIRVAGGLFDIPNFYQNKARPDGLGYGWYLQRLKACVDLAYEESGGEKVILIGHSAGGWLARAAMGDGVWADADANESANANANESANESAGSISTDERIACLVTIGAIHRTPRDAKSCVTRGALKFVEDRYPGAFLKEKGITYVSVGGSAIAGKRDEDDNDDNDDNDDEIQSNADEVYAIRGEGSAAKVAFSSYEAVCGDGNAIGDGVVPLDWSMLEGSIQLKLDGVLHSINEAGTTLPTDRWYGAENAVQQWLPTVVDEMKLEDKSMNTSRRNTNVLEDLQRFTSTIFRR